MTKNESRKKLSTSPPDTRTQNHFVEKRERTTPPAENKLLCRQLGGRSTQTLAAKSQ